MSPANPITYVLAAGAHGASVDSMRNDRILEQLHDRWLEPLDHNSEEVISVRMTIEVDFRYDGDMKDIDDVTNNLAEVLASGAESTCSDLDLIRVVSHETL